MKKLDFKLLLIFLMFLFACSGSNDEITESKKSVELSEQKVNKISTLINFNPDDYSRKCLTDTIGPQKTYEAYESNKIESNLMNQIRVCELTNGAFNISVGRAVNTWGFGPRNKEIFDKSKLLSNTHRHSCNTYEIIDNSIYKLQDVHLDLSAIAKGYAIDKASAYLEENNVENYFIELGGEVSFKGKKEQGFWSIGIINPKNIY